MKTQQTNQIQIKHGSHIFKVDSESLADHVPRVELAILVNIQEIEKTLHSIKLDGWKNKYIRNNVEYCDRQIQQLKGMLQGLDQHYQEVEN